MRFPVTESSILNDGDKHAATVDRLDFFSWRYRAAADIRLFLAAADVTAAIPHFIPFEMRAVDALCRLGFLPALRQRALIAVLRMETVIYMALELISAMKPRAGANENIAGKPFRAVVAGGRTVIRRDVIVTIGTFGATPMLMLT